MTEIVLASRNRKKIEELNALLSALMPKPVSVLSLDDIGYSGEIEENGSSFEENAIIKASVPASMGFIGIADDSGLSVDVLGGAPGIYSARYSAEGTDEANNAKLISEIAELPRGMRGAEYVCAMACVLPKGYSAEAVSELMPAADLIERFADGKECFTVRGICRGTIITKARGKGGFGYDPYFFLPKLGKTMAELTREEKSSISHRGNAMRAFIPALAKVL